MDLAFISWPFLGALIGMAAASRRGFSVVAGAIGGLLLGPLAFLMFLVSGVSRSDKRKKCPHCAELIKVEAAVCKHCGREVSAPAGVAPPPYRGAEYRSMRRR